jgi:hypothetical protein
VPASLSPLCFPPRRRLFSPSLSLFLQERKDRPCPTPTPKFLVLFVVSTPIPEECQEDRAHAKRPLVGSQVPRQSVWSLPTFSPDALLLAPPGNDVGLVPVAWPSQTLTLVVHEWQRRREGAKIPSDETDGDLLHSPINPVQPVNSASSISPFLQINHQSPCTDIHNRLVYSRRTNPRVVRFFISHGPLTLLNPSPSR